MSTHSTRDSMVKQERSSDEWFPGRRLAPSLEAASGGHNCHVNQIPNIRQHAWYRLPKYLYIEVHVASPVICPNLSKPV